MRKNGNTSRDLGQAFGNRTARLISRWDSWLLPILIFPAAIPFLTHGFPQTADGTLHLYRLALLRHHIHEGLLYPRWVPDLVLGLGYPVFHFYSPATYYIGQLLLLLGFNDGQALLGAFTLLIVLAGYGMRLLAYDLFAGKGATSHRWQALVAAVAYVYAPYLMINVYIRGALAEVGAMALFPWIFWSFRRLLKEERPERYLLPASLSLGGLVITHNISLLFIPPVLLAYLFVAWEPKLIIERIKWVGAAGLAAVGGSAFFWLPLLAERHYLSEVAYEQAAGFIYGHVWTLSNFLDTSLLFHYTTTPPFRLGLTQLLLAVAGFLLARRYDREWFFWLGLAGLGSLGISRLAATLWHSSQILLIAQFPWRLLSLVTPALALLTPGILEFRSSNRKTAVISLLLLGIIMIGHFPDLEWSKTQDLAVMANPQAAVAHFEREIGALGTSSSREFMPKWVDGLNLTTPSAGTEPETVVLHEVTPDVMYATVTAAEASQLRWYDFYFPGWQVQMDGDTMLEPYPSTNLGLLTVDIPAGEHEITLRWQGTLWQRVASLISVFTGTAVIIFLGFTYWPKRPYLVIPVFLVLAAILTIRWWLPVPSTFSTPAQSIDTGSLKLIGYQIEQRQDYVLNVKPYWYVNKPATGFQPRWLLLDSNGNVLSFTETSPYFGAGQANNWPAGTIVDDAYALSLPPGLAGGIYRLYLVSAVGARPSFVGDVTLTRTPAVSSTNPVLDVHFGSELDLRDYDIEINGRSLDPESLPVVEPGDRLQYTLYWQALHPLDVNYRGTINVTNANWESLMQEDHIPGVPFSFPRLWNPHLVQADVYRLQIPEHASSGLYWPRLALYLIEDEEFSRLEVTEKAGNNYGGIYSLPPFKVVNNPEPVTPQKTEVALDQMAHLIGYELVLPGAELHAGDTLTLTLSYESEQPVSTDYTQFIHLFSNEAGMAAQADKKPQNGNNPTSVWAAGEIIVDSTTLTVSADAIPGVYTLFVGFYDPDTGQRLPAYNAAGTALPDAQISLAQVTIR